MPNTSHLSKLGKTISVLSILLLAAALLAGCGSGGAAENEEGPPQEKARSEEAAREAPPKAPPEKKGGEEGRAPVVVRLSGAPGTWYAGNYGNLDKSEYAEGVMEDKPVEFEVDVRDSGFDVVDVSFVNPRNKGSLSVEMLVDGEVVNQMDTDSQYGAMRLSWSFGG